METITLSSYESPAVAIEQIATEEEPAPVWAVLVGWSLALGFAYAGYCTATGGSYAMDWSWRGIKVSCYR